MTDWNIFDRLRGGSELDSEEVSITSPDQEGNRQRVTFSSNFTKRFKKNNFKSISFMEKDNLFGFKLSKDVVSTEGNRFTICYRDLNSTACLGNDVKTISAGRYIAEWEGDVLVIDLDTVRSS